MEVSERITGEPAIRWRGMPAARWKSWQRWMRAFPMVASAAVALSHCTYPATAVSILVDSDAPRDRLLTVRWHLAPGALALADLPAAAASATTRTGTLLFNGAGDAGFSLPASFAITPNRAHATDEPVTLWLDGTLDTNAPTQPEIHFERVIRFRFASRVSAAVRVFLPVACGDRAVGCTTVDASLCNVSTRCAEQQATCGDRGECIPIDATPQLPDASAMDAALAIDAITGRSTCTPDNFPTAANTGVPSGTTFTQIGDDYSTMADGEIIDGLEVAHRIYVNHNNVTIRNSRIHGDTYYSIYTNGVSNLTVERCDIFNAMTLGSSSHVLIHANHFSSEGLAHHGLLSGTDILFDDNLIDGLTGTVGSESVGLNVLGVAVHTIIRHNVIDAQSDNTGWALSLSNIGTDVPIDTTIECNLLRAPAATNRTITLNAGPPTIVRNNRFALPPNPMGEVLSAAPGGIEWTDNSYTDGTVVPAPN